jgi:glycosyltransferase involved in cell wall biosynthesis
VAEPYRVYHLPSREPNACSFYRTIQPIATMEKLGLPLTSLPPGLIDRMGPNFQAQAFLECDFNLQHQPADGFNKEMMEVGKKLKPQMGIGDQVQYPPTFIVDVDDDLFNVGPLNVTYQVFGIRHSDGTPLNDGDGVLMAHPLEIAPGPMQARLNRQHPMPLTGAKEKIDDELYIYDRDQQWHRAFEMWKDGKNINIKSNRERLERVSECVKMADLVTCSTPKVGAALERELGQKLPIFVTPNAINMNEFPEVELREHPDEIRLLWEGAGAHHEGLWKINPALEVIMEKYPNVTIYFFGAPYKWAKKNLPANRVKMIPWVPYDAYKLRLSTLNFDINLAPSAPNVFNDSRSAIRFYEASAICKPAATIAQRWGAYGDEILDGETGMLFSDNEELITKLGGLIEDAKLRQTLASNAKDWVRTYRDADRIGLRLFQKYVEVREEYKLHAPPAEEPTYEYAVDPAALPAENKELVSADAA